MSGISLEIRLRSKPQPRQPAPGASARAMASLGEWLRRHQRVIGLVQWGIIGLYMLLVAVPAFLPLPTRAAHIWSNLTLFAQFAFWGLWWPFVLLSMVVVGRSWCGLFCPEGAITERVSRHGLGLPVPRWIRWRGWPFAAFAMTTIYGQMTSVYQYPKPVLLILGGSTVGSMVVGYLYGRDKRVWCRYLCPVNGVFGVLAKLAPMHFRVDEEAWARSRRAVKIFARRVNCAPLVALPVMKGASDCHMCGRCSQFRGAIELAPRAPNHEIVHVTGSDPKPWETVLIVVGLMGVAAGAFHWSTSPWYYGAKTWIATWLIDHGATWVLSIQPPWWMLTNYPESNDALTLLDGTLLVAYILATAAVIATGVAACLAAATLALGRWRSQAFHHLAQALIPIAGCGVFLGLFAITISMLKADGITAAATVSVIRGAMLFGAWAWVVSLTWPITGRYASSLARRGAATAAVAGAAGIGVFSWVLLFFIWA
jgi:polyferredoxin